MMEGKFGGKHLWKTVRLRKRQRKEGSTNSCNWNIYDIYLYIHMLCNVSVGRELCKAAVRALPLLCRHKVCHHLIWGHEWASDTLQYC